MSEDASKYKVDNNLLEDYLRMVVKKRIYYFLVVLIIVIPAQAFIAYRMDNDFPLITWMVVIILVILVAFMVGVRFYIDKLKQFVDAQYFIDDETISQQKSNNDNRNFKFNRIAVVQKISAGTIIVKGGMLTKINYYRPKRGSYQVDSSDVIFIPTITTNYADLIYRIKKLRKK